MAGVSTMSFNRIFDRLTTVKTQPFKVQIVELLQKTWANIAADYCEDVLKAKRPCESINRDDIARVNVLPDEARCAVYNYMNRWEGTREQRVLDEWLDTHIEDQNELLIEAFPDGQVYGV